VVLRQGGSTPTNFQKDQAVDTLIAAQYSGFSAQEMGGVTTSHKAIQAMLPSAIT
jgi:hypothetical protein